MASAFCRSAAAHSHTLRGHLVSSALIGAHFRRANLALAWKDKSDLLQNVQRMDDSRYLIHHLTRSFQAFTATGPAQQLGIHQERLLRRQLEQA